MKLLIADSCSFPNTNLIRKILFEEKNLSIVGIDQLDSSLSIKNIYHHRNFKFYPGFVDDKNWLKLINKLQSSDIYISQNHKYEVDLNLLKLKSTSHLLSDEEDAYSQGIYLIYDKLFGPRQEIPNLIPEVVKNILANKKTILAGSYDDEIEWLYVEDLITIVNSMIKEFLPTSQKILFLHSGLHLPQGEMVYKICKILDKGFDLFNFDLRKNCKLFGESKKTFQNIESFPFIPTNFMDSLEKTIDWYLHNQWYLKEI